MNAIQYIKAEARSYGACRKVLNLRDWEDAAALFWSPQGIEFFKNKCCLDIEKWEQIAKDCNLTEYGVYLNQGEINIPLRKNIAVIGNTIATIRIDSPTILHQIIIAHGAKAQIIVENYGVVAITEVGDVSTQIVADKTAIIL